MASLIFSQKKAITISPTKMVLESIEIDDECRVIFIADGTGGHSGGVCATKMIW